MQKMLAPFSCSYTPNVPEFLQKLGCSIAISTYQAGKVIFLSPKDSKTLTQLPRNFKKAMGIHLSGNKLAVATKDEILVLSNSKHLAYHYPKKPKTYDALFMPRATYYTGALDVHDVAWSKKGELYAINTSFSCLIKIDHDYSFTPVWQPPFIDKLASEDRCHLNGMAMYQGLPKYVTAFNEGNTPKSWRENITETGIVMDIDKNEVVARGLAMPHSPRVYDNQLYVLLSASGHLAKVDTETGKTELLVDLGGFVRGMDKYGDFLFIGISKLRKTSSTFAKLPIADKAQQAGVVIIHLPSLTKVGEIRYHSSVDEIYDVHILPKILRPNILTPEKPEHKMGLVTPESTYWAKPKPDANL